MTTRLEKIKIFEEKFENRNAELRAAIRSGIQRANSSQILLVEEAIEETPTPKM